MRPEENVPAIRRIRLGSSVECAVERGDTYWSFEHDAKPMSEKGTRPRTGPLWPVYVRVQRSSRQNFMRLSAEPDGWLRLQDLKAGSDAEAHQ